ncbi:hypothetical protein PFMC_03321 [Plasmodium falciparum CAMP/Malaysia]|uniref:Uncharacterized protein n=1 Tax=Plasmodium falciparum (isolate Camp / Malaysia) TaxID=5835 RepID=A0A024X694_PLAFC|nr:hypothetical protein PFMC_03321 [Plasmodium falciparum CAMP/Malaysia]
MTTNKFLLLKKEDSYLSKLTHETVIFGENLYKIVSKTLSSSSTDPLNQTSNENLDSISFCSELLPFYCKSEIIHQGDIFNVRFGHSCLIDKHIIYIYGGNQDIKSYNTKLIEFNLCNKINNI